ncbi:hypothetical protein MASR1M65_04510 [Saprospiraceae bacterium]
MERITGVVLVLPVPLVAAALGQGAASRNDLLMRVQALTGRLAAAGAVMHLPEDPAAALEEGLAPLIARGVVTSDLQPVPSGAALLAFYAPLCPRGLNAQRVLAPAFCDAADANYKIKTSPIAILRNEP